MLSILNRVDQILVLESKLYGRQLRRLSDGKVYNVEKILAEKWTLEGGEGWWIKLLIENNGSHGLIYWQNINCTEPYVRKACAQAQHQYEWLPGN